MSEHTPLPWHVAGEYGEWVNDELNMNICRVNTTVSLSSHGTTRSDGPKSAKANAEFIVRACNFHEELLRVRDIAIDIEACLCSGVPVPEFMQLAFSDAITASAKAKERKQ